MLNNNAQTPYYIPTADVGSRMGGDFMKGSLHYDKKSKRYYIALCWEGDRYRFFRHKISGDPLWSKQSAEKQLGKLRTEVDEGIFNPKHWKHGCPLLVKVYAMQWLDSIDVTPKTSKDYSSYVRKYFIPYFGVKDIRHIRYNDIVKFHKWIPQGDKTKYNVVSALKTMLRHAWKSEDISKVPPFPKLSYTKPEIVFLGLEQQETVLGHIPERHRPIYQFMMEYGLRPQEARALQKDSITNGEVVIRRAFSENTLRETTKTNIIRRYEITPYFKEVLQGIAPHLSPYVFVREDGKPYTSKNLNELWHEACDNADIHIKMYNAVKHSLGCQLLDQGEDIDLVRQLYGHTKSEMVQRYAKRSNAVITSALINRRNVVDFTKKQEGDVQ